MQSQSISDFKYERTATFIHFSFQPIFSFKMSKKFHIFSDYYVICSKKKSSTSGGNSKYVLRDFACLFQKFQVVLIELKLNLISVFWNRLTTKNNTHFRLIRFRQLTFCGFSTTLDTSSTTFKLGVCEPNMALK